MTCSQLCRGRTLHHHMLFTMRDWFSFRQIQEADSGWRILRTDSFVAQIEAQTIGAGLAHNPRQHQSCVKEIEIGDVRTVTEIPQHASARTRSEEHTSELQSR